jgi:hypothetical protein
MKPFLTAAVLIGILSAALAAESLQWQDPNVKILGDVANGPPLEPQAGTGGTITSPPWGPRKFGATGVLLNLSSRAFVSGTDHPLISGLVVSPGNRIVMIRAVGPTLARFNVPTPLARPQLELFDSTGKRIAVAVPWSTTSNDTKIEFRNAAISCGAFALDEGSNDAILLVNLQPGSYTCVVSGPISAQGEALLEAYNVNTISLGQ